MRIESVAHEFTHEYSQPDDYHFCQDSVIAPRLIAQDLGPLTPDARVLDVCAGCGVMGFELASVRPEIAAIDFMEIQPAFASSFAANLEITGHSPSQFRFLQASYASLMAPEARATYDVIIGNPPYFQASQASLTQNEMKNRCRFFIDESFETLLKGVANALKPEGRAYLLMKSGEKHGSDRLTRARVVLMDFNLELLADVRGTHLVKITAR